MITDQPIRHGRLLSFADDDGCLLEHAIVLQSYTDSLSIEQNGNSITIPVSDVPSFLRAVRKVASL
jgi:hypothetical protein